jgi:hypothetical protein
MKAGDLIGGGLFRWLARGLTLTALLLVPLLRYLFGVPIVIAALIGFSALLLGLLVLWALVASGRIKVEI